MTASLPYYVSRVNNEQRNYLTAMANVSSAVISFDQTHACDSRQLHRLSHAVHEAKKLTISKPVREVLDRASGGHLPVENPADPPELGEVLAHLRHIDAYVGVLERDVHLKVQQQNKTWSENHELREALHNAEMRIQHLLKQLPPVVPEPAAEPVAEAV